MADETNKPSDGLENWDQTDDAMTDILYARHAEIESFADLEKQRGTPIPALFNQLYKFVQNPSSVSVETYKRMIDTDDTIGSGVDFLIMCLIARLGRYEHPSNEVTEFVNKALDEMSGGREENFKEILSAAWAGFFVGEQVWANKDNGFVIQKIVPLPPTTVLFETERTGELTPDGILQYQRNYNPYIQGNGAGYTGAGMGIGFIGYSSSKPDAFARFGDFPFPLRTANSFNYLCIRIPRQKCIHYTFNAGGKMGNPYGRSLLRRAYKFYVMKDAIMQMKLIALDRKGTALTVVYVDPNAMVEDSRLNPEGQNTDTMRNNAKAGVRADMAAREAFKNIHNDSVIILPGKKDEMYGVDFMPQSSNVADFILAEDFCNKSMLRSLLLPSLIFGNGDGTGSYALGQEHAKTFDKICDSINSGLGNALIEQIVKPLIAYNFPKSVWLKDGLGTFGKRELTPEEIEKEMTVIETAVNLGAIDMNDMKDYNKVRETVGFEPKNQEEFTKIQADKEAAAEAATGLGGIGEETPQEINPEEDPKEAKEAKKLWARLVAFIRGKK
jgi:hypothetical protein